MDDVKNEVRKLKSLLKRDLKKEHPSSLFKLSDEARVQVKKRQSLVCRGINPTAEKMEVLDVETLSEMVDKAMALHKEMNSARNRIRRYTDLMHTDTELDELFEKWLEAYSLVALLEENSLRSFWFKFAETHNTPVDESRKDDFYWITGKDGKEHVVFRNKRKAEQRRPGEPAAERNKTSRPHLAGAMEIAAEIGCRTENETIAIPVFAKGEA